MIEENNRNDPLQYIANIDTVPKSRIEAEEEREQRQEQDSMCSRNESRRDSMPYICRI